MVILKACCVLWSLYLLPKRKASTQKILTIEPFGSYIWLQVSIKVVTLFIHVNHHPMATHISTLRTETHNKDFSHVKWDCTHTHTYTFCMFGAWEMFWMKWILMCVCVFDITTVLVLKRKKMFSVDGIPLESTTSMMFIHIEMCVNFVCQSHAPKYRKLNVQITFRASEFYFGEWYKLNSIEWST